MSTISSISPVGLSSLSSITPVSALLSTSAAAQTTGLSAFGNTSSIVELSGLGQLLSAVSVFQTNLTVLQPGSTNSGLGQHFGTDFGSLAAEAQNFVDTFNNLQSNINLLQGPFGTIGGNFGNNLNSTLLFSQFADTLKQQLTATFDNGNSSLKTLAQIGINFQPSATPGSVGTLSIDLATLQSAFTTDQTGTFSLLAEAAQSFANLAGGFVERTAGLSTTLDSLIQLEATTQILSLFDNLQSNSGTGLFGISNFLLLDSLTQDQSAGSSNTLQRLAAVSQFTLVSSLL